MGEKDALGTYEYILHIDELHEMFKTKTILVDTLRMKFLTSFKNLQPRKYVSKKIFHYSHSLSLIRKSFDLSCNIS